MMRQMFDRPAKRDSFPITEKTTTFLIREGGKTFVKLGRTPVGIVQKRDGFFVAQFPNGALICPKQEHTLKPVYKEGPKKGQETGEKIPQPMGPFLKTVRDALIARFFPNPSPLDATNAPQAGG